MNIRLLLQKLNEYFPLPQEFKGKHSITLDADKVVLNIWWNNQSWAVKLSPEEESRVNYSEEFISEFLIEVKNEIERGV